MTKKILGLKKMFLFFPPFFFFVGFFFFSADKVSFFPIKVLKIA